MINEAVENAFKKRGQVNVLIAGRTGVGKSTLINAVFQGNLATTGQGRPVTTHVREIHKEGIPLTILDTRGLELADFDDTLNALKQILRERKASPDPTKHIHVAWICISEDSRRVELAESKLCEMLAEYCPVVGVITKARSDSGFRAEVQSLLPEARNVVRVRAIPEVFDDGHAMPPEGLVALIELTEELVPEAHRNALSAAQRVSIRIKKIGLTPQLEPPPARLRRRGHLRFHFLIGRFWFLFRSPC